LTVVVILCWRVWWHFQKAFYAQQYRRRSDHPSLMPNRILAFCERVFRSLRNRKRQGQGDSISLGAVQS